MPGRGDPQAAQGESHASSARRQRSPDHVDERHRQGRCRARHGGPLFSLFLLDRTARDAAERLRRERDASLLAPRHAVELNDTIVQGLAVALYALDAGDNDQATAVVRDTLATARGLVASLLEASDGR